MYLPMSLPIQVAASSIGRHWCITV